MSTPCPPPLLLYPFQGIVCRHRRKLPLPSLILTGLLFPAMETNTETRYISLKFFKTTFLCIPINYPLMVCEKVRSLSFFKDWICWASENPVVKKIHKIGFMYRVFRIHIQLSKPLRSIRLRCWYDQYYWLHCRIIFAWYYLTESVLLLM